MSYEKAMKHSIKKSRKQANNHFGFDTGGFKEDPQHRAFICQCMEVQRWFTSRHDGSNRGSQHMRECVRESIATLRKMKNNFGKSQSA